MTRKDNDDRTRDELLERVHDLEENLDDQVSKYSRRSVIAAAAGVASLGAMGVYATGASAAPTGTFPDSNEEPLLKVRADRIRLVPRTSDPSTPDDGVMWYRGDL